MSKNDSNTNNGGVGFIGLLTIVFITLKLLNKITWSWLWVLSPIWITASVIIVIFIILVLVAIFKD